MSGRDYGRELYPFLYEDGGGDVDGAALGTLIEQVSASTLAKAREVVELRARMLADHGDELTAAATAMAAAFARGGCLLAFGNGGSATDAADAAADCIRPPVAEWRPLPALSLAADPSVVTAIANDVGFDNVFSRQVIAYGRAGDVAVGFSTSGSSRNVLAGLAQAHRQGLLTIAFGGYDGDRQEPPRKASTIA